MKLVEEMEKLQKQYYGTIILVKNGIFLLQLEKMQLHCIIPLD